MSRVLYHLVLERVHRVGWMASADDQSCLLEVIQGGADLVRRSFSDSAKYFVRELSANGGPDLRDLLERPHAIETSHERVGQRCGYRQLTPWTGENVTSLLLGKKVGFEHRLGQLLDEQRHAVGLDDDLLDDFLGKLRAHHAFDQRRTLLAAQSIEGQRRDMVVRIPARLKLRAAGNDDEDGSVLDPVDQEIEHLSGGWVDPVGILKGDHQRLVARQPDQMIHQRGDGMRPFAAAEKGRAERIDRRWGSTTKPRISASVVSRPHSPQR